MLNLGILHDLYLRDGKRALELYDRYLALSPGGDATVAKWVADLKNRKPQHAMLSREGEGMKPHPLGRCIGRALCTGARARRCSRRTAPTSTAPRSSATASCPRCCTSCRGRSRCPATCRAGRMASVLDEALAPVDRDVFRRQVRYDAQVQAAAAPRTRTGR